MRTQRLDKRTRKTPRRSSESSRRGATTHLVGVACESTCISLSELQIVQGLINALPEPTHSLSIVAFVEMEICHFFIQAEVIWSPLEGRFKEAERGVALLCLLGGIGERQRVVIIVRFQGHGSLEMPQRLGGAVHGFIGLAKPIIPVGRWQQYSGLLHSRNVFVYYIVLHLLI